MTDGYVHPEVLVSTDWVDEHREDTQRIRIVESDEDVLLYETGHIPEAVKVDWINHLNDPVIRDYVNADRFSDLCSQRGIGNDTTVVFYGDKSNWWACYAFWVFRLYGHKNCLIMDGARAKWQAERRPMSTQVPSYPSASYRAANRDQAIRAFQDEVQQHMQAGKPLVDVRSPQEYSGDRTHMPEYPQEGVLRGGHIPGAVNVPWARAVNEDGTFKSRDALEQIYVQEQGLRADDQIIAYCRIGERSSHTWFVLTYLLGFENVKNYDGSWTEWGNSVGVPIEKSVKPASAPT